MNHTTKNRSPFLNLTQDVIFKSYFKPDKNLLKSLLNAFLPLPDKNFIKDIVILDSLLPSLTLEEKSSLMDLRVQLDSGEFVNVEMQAFPHKSFTQRILLYWAKNYSFQLKTGEDYKTLSPAHSLIFSVYDLFPETESFYTSFAIRSDETPYFCFNEDLRLVTVELSKFKKRSPSALLDLREEWCYLLKESRRMGEREGRELSAKGEDMKKAMFRLKELSREEGLQLVAEAKEKARRDQAAREQDSFDEGFAKGKELSREEGLQLVAAAKEKARRDQAAREQDSFDDGRQEGRQERDKEVVLTMLKKKLDVSFISEVTGLSEKEIKKLKNGA